MQWFGWENGEWLRVKIFSPNIIIEENIGIFIWELNKVHDIGVQSLGDKENKEVVQLKSFINGSFVYPCTLSIMPWYSDTNLISLLSYVST